MESRFNRASVLYRWQSSWNAATCLLAATLSLVFLSGCGPGTDELPPPADASSGGTRTPEGASEGLPVPEGVDRESLAGDQSSTQPPLGGGPVDDQRSRDGQAGDSRPGTFSLNQDVPSPGPGAGAPGSAMPLNLSEQTEDRPGGRRLRRDLSPDQLTDFLSGADEDMRLIVVDRNHFRDDQERLTELRRIVTLKREAASRLMEHPEATEKQKVTGRRGTLQALSHLASLGDLAAAEELEQLAAEFRQDPDIDLSTDSRLVLIGFAIEELRHGKEAAADTVVRQIQDLVASSDRADVASLMVMGQAKDVLQQYGHGPESETVSQVIRDTFEDAADPAVATMARQIAGVPVSEAWNSLSKLRETMLQNAEAATDSTGPSAPTVERWTEALNDFWTDRVEADAMELPTVQFLAGLSLEAEVVGRPELAEATYQLLRERVAERQDPLGREARTALQARKNRQQVIGQQLDPDLPSVRGGPLSMDQYRGQVVLMPFWSSEFPESLGLVPAMQAIRDQSTDSPSAGGDPAVAIVGMNLDVAGADPAEFMKQAGLDFPSFRSVSDPSAKIVNEVAFRFGAVTLQYVVVIDQEGRVSSIHFSDRDLEQAVAKLID